MNIEHTINRIKKCPSVSEALQQGLLSGTQVQSDDYLYLGKNYDVPIYCVTSSIFFGDDKLQRDVDLPSFAMDKILQEGLVLAFVGLTSVKFKTLNEKNFFSVGSPLIPFGLQWFDNNFTFGTPIVLVEGEKDAMVFHQFYPYVISAGTSNLSTTQRLILSTITDKLICAQDNDTAGDKGAHNLTYDKRFQTLRFVYPSTEKDIGDLLKHRNDSFTYDYLVSYYRNQIGICLQSLRR